MTHKAGLLQFFLVSFGDLGALVVADRHYIRSHPPQVSDDGGNVLALLNGFNLARLSESETLRQ